jgi:hypothetical protein
MTSCLPSPGRTENPAKRSKLRKREPTDLERYGHWQDVLIFVGLVLLGVVIAQWVWGG